MMRQIDLNKILIKIGTLPTSQKLLGYLGRELKPERWIFVVGCYNSGTTLLTKILGQHPLIGSMPDEGVAFTDSLPYPEQFGWTRMWHRCIDNVRLGPNSLSPETIRRIKKQWAFWYTKDAPILIEKSIANTARMPFLQTHFQPAYFIALVRNGYAVAEGIRRKARLDRWKNVQYPDSYPIVLCAEQWRVTDEIIKQDSAFLRRFKQIYYEDLTTRPAQTLLEIMNFLDLPPLNTGILNRTWSIQEKKEPIVNMNERSFHRLFPPDLDIIESVAGESLKNHDYRRPSSAI